MSVSGSEHGTAEEEARAFSVERIRAHFPGLDQRVHGRPLAYLDNASTTQKPRVVLDALERANTLDCANVHRGVHVMSVRATAAFETTRKVAARFVGASEPAEMVFTRGTTESLNLVAQSYGPTVVGRGDAVVVSEMEHHSNLVPWQMLCQRQGARLVKFPMREDGTLEVDRLAELIDDRTAVVAVCHASNSLGTVNDIAKITSIAHAAGATVVVDGAQAVAHGPVDVQALDCDFYAFSGHKAFGPSGVGVLYGKRDLLEDMPPWMGGGEMVAEVRFEETTYADLPHKFEAGTPPLASVIGLGPALEFLSSVGFAGIAAHEQRLLEYATDALGSVEGLRIIGTASDKVPVVSFVLEGVHPHDIGTIVDLEGVAIRTGHHCTQPVMDHYGIPATARCSMALYNTAQEIDQLVAALDTVRNTFA